MGVLEYIDQSPIQLRREQRKINSGEGVLRSHDDNQPEWFPRKYRTVNDLERISNSSTDDSCSSADDAYDSASQTSDTSAATEITDWSLGDEDVFVNYVSQNSLSIREVQSKISARVESRNEPGAQSSTQNLTQANIEALQRDDASWKGRRPLHPYDTTGAIGPNALYESVSQQGVSASTFGSKCHRRRSASQTSTAGPPCKLKRDTDSADCFVTLLIIFATRLITAIWPLSASPPMMSSCFNGAGVLPLRVFIQETLRRSKTSYSTLQVALFYLILLKGKLSDCDFTKEQPSSPDCPLNSGERTPPRAMQCGRRMFLAALMLASKYLQDRNYSTRAWSKISGLRSAEINENETAYLQSINYNLHMTKESFENWSKIVLTLSKLSKLQSGGHPSNFQSIPKSGPGMDSILADMESSISGQKSSHGLEIYSDEWWNSVISRLEPDLVKDSQKTEGFLRDNVPVDDVTDLLTRLDHTLSTTPGGPDSSHRYNPDMTFSEALQSRGAPSKPVTPVIQTPSASPVRSANLPLRPQPRNLPTPQSTPRVPEACQWLQIMKSSNPPLRCSASVDALRNMRRQCVMNANLERCPPPRRPHSLVLPAARSLMRPAELKQECPSSLATTSTLSPVSSVTSESSIRAARSRSSSISSNSSWSSWACGPPKALQPSGESTHLSSPLAKVCSMSDDRPSTTSCRSSKPTQVSIPRKTSPLASSSVSGFTPQTKRDDFSSFRRTESPESMVLQDTFPQHVQSPDTTNAVDALMAMSSRQEWAAPCRRAVEKQLSQIHRHQSARSPPRGHKRTISRANDSLQEHVSQSLKLQGIVDEVVKDPIPTTHMQLERQWQTPTKSWASARKPMPNSLDNKRLALHCAVQQYSSAPELASQYLIPQDHAVTV